MSSMNESFDYDSARLNEIVEQVLRSAITNCSIPAGSILKEGALVHLFELSRAPILQALRRLQRDGLVRKLNGQGYLVGMPQGSLAKSTTPVKFSIPAEAVRALHTRAGWEKIYRQVERDVVGVMPFGRYHVVEQLLAEIHGVSRTVTRDLLSRLEERGFLEKQTRSHWVVPQLTSRLMHDHYEVRRLLEPAALIHAAQQVSLDDVAAMRDRLRDAEARYPKVSIDELSGFENDLHVELIGLCPNQRITSAIRQSQTLLVATAYLFQQYLGIPQDEPFLVEHRLVLEHLLLRAPNAAAAALESHLISALGKGQKRLEYLARIERPAAAVFLQAAN